MLTVKCQRFFSVAANKTMKSSVIILHKKFEGFPTESNFQLVQEDVPPLKDGEFLAQAEYVSVDPYMRVFPVEVGKPVGGDQVAKIIESKNEKYPVGKYVVGEFGWRTHTVASETPGSFFNFPPRVLQGYGDLPKSLALGILGMPGNTAYFGFLRICKPVEGNTVVVSGAAGCVGSTVGQIAKIMKCKVVGITGSDAKGRRLISEFNFDAYVNYKSPNFHQELTEATPDKVDCYFDNVGGEVSSAVLNRMNKFGRVAICGAISTYNNVPGKASEVQTPVKIAHVRMEGFSVTRWRNQWDEGIQQNMEWIRQGNLKYAECISDGFENTAKAFIDLFGAGDRNFGKVVVKV
jgi:prostaglandin reductase 1